MYTTCLLAKTNIYVLKTKAANAREKRRIDQMTKAFIRLKEILPNSGQIQSKKQIVDQVIFL